jgi:hypothetical protein
MKTPTCVRTSLPAANSSPDQVNFGATVRAWNQGGTTFSFFGVDRDKVAYSTKRPHTFVFNAIKQAREEILAGSALSTLSSHFEDYDVRLSPNATEADIQAFLESGQWHQDMGQTRINTRSGRFWRNLAADSSGRTFDVVAFWCAEQEVTPTELGLLKSLFGLKRIAYCAIGSKCFLTDTPASGL